MKIINKLLMILVAIFFINMLVSCKGRIEIKVFGSDIIEGYFIKDSTVEGDAKYYDKGNGKLSYICTYHNGIQIGKAVHYFLNSGITRDSSFYINDLMHGFSYAFDTLGKLILQQNHYYGLMVGDRLYFNSGKLNAYFFSDFEQNDIFRCDYDSLGKCKLVFFNFTASLTNRLGQNRQPSLGVFLYFPKPPNLTITQTIGLRNAKKETKENYILPNNRLFLDTTLNYPDSGWHYYISTHVESTLDSINRIYIQELKHD